MAGAPINIGPPRGAEDWDAARDLCRQYRAFLAAQPSPDREAVLAAYGAEAFAKILAELEQKHTPPNGALVLAKRADGRAVGCGMAQRLSGDLIEFKRIFVGPDARGMGVGRAIVSALLEAADDLGGTRVVMDTGRGLTSAQHLYEDMGFVRCGPYSDISGDVAKLLVFYERAL